MFVLDDITIILGVSMMLIAIATPVFNVLTRRLPLRSANEDTAEDMCSEVKGSTSPGISVVITVDGEGHDLRNNLPSLLSQDYDGDYQIIVVVCSKDELTESVLKQYASDVRLYATFIPSSSRYMSRRKLAITIGVKAAKYDWVVLTDVNCRPTGKRWLETMASNCTESTGIVMGYSNFDDSYKAVRRFDQCFTIYRQMQKASRGVAWGYAGNNLMFRKSMFIDGKGFDGNLKYIRGEYDFIVNKFSTSNNTHVELSSEASILVSPLSDKAWRNKNLYYMATRKKLNRTYAIRLVFNTTMWAMVLGYVLPLSVGTFSILTERWLLCIVAAVTFLLTIMLRMYMLSSRLRIWLRGMSPATMLVFEMLMPLRNMVRIIRYRMADKLDFICHKV